MRKIQKFKKGKRVEGSPIILSDPRLYPKTVVIPNTPPSPIRPGVIVEDVPVREGMYEDIRKPDTPVYFRDNNGNLVTKYVTDAAGNKTYVDENGQGSYLGSDDKYHYYDTKYYKAVPAGGNTRITTNLEDTYDYRPFSERIQGPLKHLARNLELGLGAATVILAPETAPAVSGLFLSELEPALESSLEKLPLDALNFFTLDANAATNIRKKIESTEFTNSIKKRIKEGSLINPRANDKASNGYSYIPTVSQYLYGDYPFDDLTTQELQSLLKASQQYHVYEQQPDGTWIHIKNKPDSESEFDWWDAPWGSIVGATTKYGPKGIKKGIKYVANNSKFLKKMLKPAYDFFRNAGVKGLVKDPLALGILVDVGRYAVPPVYNHFFGRNDKAVIDREQKKLEATISAIVEEVNRRRRKELGQNNVESSQQDLNYPDVLVENTATPVENIDTLAMEKQAKHDLDSIISLWDK